MSDNAFIHKETFNLLCDERIGYGVSRSTWSSKLLPDCVIKVEEGARKFQNIVEWETWQRVKDTKFSRWFAECKWVSPCGGILVMERTRTPSDKDYPDKMPAFLCDFKRQNFGMSGKWLVCHDYGTNLLFENGMTTRMQRVKWWDE